MTVDAAPRTRHETITLSRLIDAAPDQVFRAFADTELRRRWVRMPGRLLSAEHDFRVGGGERLEAAFPRLDAEPERLLSTLRYLAIDPERLVYGYESTVDDVVRWSSLVTVELHPEGSGTRLDWTEQVAFLERTGDGGADLPHLRGAIQLRLNGLQQVVTTSS
jgi:uncharacterized protein YndB with AHSA1/START domain